MQILIPAELPEVETADSYSYAPIVLILVCLAFAVGVLGVILHQNKLDKAKAVELKPTKLVRFTGILSTMLAVAGVLVLIGGFAADSHSQYSAFPDSLQKTQTENKVQLKSWLEKNYAINATASEADKLLSDDSVLLESQGNVISVSLTAYKGGYILVQSVNTRVVPQLNGVRNG